MHSRLLTQVLCANKDEHHKGQIGAVSGGDVPEAVQLEDLNIITEHHVNAPTRKSAIITHPAESEPASRRRRLFQVMSEHEIRHDDHIEAVADKEDAPNLKVNVQHALERGDAHRPHDQPVLLLGFALGIVHGESAK
eukprot:CAMPEP_0197047256 /NCGR_PEP_ID=MMETSP1384-20130603/22781_1 /TAXON_ID=29189 /ORGANISM="Ammonia sp." /LENGTH=136 /DNA_ID=CAMNT_0042479151 /DNA_START=313 /DNA_END=723 /DNA_ORIENTATION=+